MSNKRHPRRIAAAERTWAVGRIDVIANKRPCFRWQGTRRDAIDAHKHYVALAEQFAGGSLHKRYAGYLMAYGMPRAGDQDRRPSSGGGVWSADEIEILKVAMLSLILREHLPGTIQTLEAIFAGKWLEAHFDGDAEWMIEYSRLEARGADVYDPKKQFQMKVGVRDHDFPLDPDAAISMRQADLCKLAGKDCPEGLRDNLVYVPRIPIDAIEANAMQAMATVFTDLSGATPATNPDELIKVYVGYTDDELRRGSPAVLVK